MKKVITLLFILGIFSGVFTKTYGQTPEPPFAIVDIGDETSYPGTVFVPIEVDFDKGKVVRSFEFKINFDSSVIEFVGLADVNPIFSARIDAVDDSPLADLVITWDSDDLDYDIAAGFKGLLLNLEFVLLNVGYSDIEFDGPDETGKTEIGGGDPGDEMADFLSSEFIDGSVTGIEPKAIPIANWSIFIGVFMIFGFIVLRFVRI